MPALIKTLRGLKDIRTLAGRVDQLTDQYRLYLKVACLELEKFRRGKERDSALVRVRDISERVQEIEAEKAALLQRVVARKVTGQAVPKASGPDSSRSGSFRLRY